ncbi:iron-containing alcohol dehydrogenase [Shigella flexneri]
MVLHGSCKAIGIISNNPEFADVRSLEGLSRTNKPQCTDSGNPTTAGTAAEVTINYVITDEEKRRKFVCVDPHDIPQVAFIDADMMDGMPPALKAATVLMRSLMLLRGILPVARGH